VAFLLKAEGRRQRAEGFLRQEAGGRGQKEGEGRRW